ncbi:MAG: amino acid ABC transporter permease [Raoultibacter sp.]|jgi:putative glutamine transport system permease protein
MFDAFAPYKWEALFNQWPEIVSAFGTTIAISVLALLIALVLGTVFGLISVSRFTVLRALTRAYVEIVQNVPLLLQVFIFYAIFPLLGLRLSTFVIGVLAIGIYHGGYISEVVRSGVGSIHRGQYEAARSQGFSYWQMMLVVILPQAMRIILPPLAVQAANLIKNTSVLALIAGGELMYFSNSFAGTTSYYGPVYVVAALLYFIICFPLSRLALRLEKRMLSNRHVATGDAKESLEKDAVEVTPGSHDITGRAAAESMAAGIQVMNYTSEIAPAPEVPSPRHPLHHLNPEEAEKEQVHYSMKGKRASLIADQIGKEANRHTEDHYDGIQPAASQSSKFASTKTQRRSAADAESKHLIDSENAGTDEIEASDESNPEKGG